MSIRLAVLGDSIGYGQGASRPAETLAVRLSAGLISHGLEVEHQVFAVPGARSADLARQVHATVGWDPDVAVIVIGANDLTHLVPVEEAVQALGDAVRRLRAAGAEVVVAPAPDFSAVPHVPPFLQPVVRAASLQLREEQCVAVMAAGGRLADLDARTARAFGSDPSLFSADRFHPSSAGYAVIAAALLPEVLAAAERG